MPKAGGIPYYVILNGDSLWCLARQFNTSIETLKNANNIDEADVIYSGNELLIAPYIPDPEQLYEKWKSIGEEGPRGDLQLYDQIQVLRTGQIGFIARKEYNEITMI